MKVQIIPGFEALKIITANIDNTDQYKINEIFSTYRAQHPTSNTSNLNCWHSHYNTHEIDPRFNQINRILTHMLEDIDYNVNSYSMTYKVQDMWFAQYEKGDSASKHHHYGSDWSCVYYIDVEENASPLMFSGGISIKPENGLVVFFNSCLSHEVPPTNGKRSCLAVNFLKEGIFDGSIRISIR